MLLVLVGIVNGFFLVKIFMVVWVIEILKFFNLVRNIFFWMFVCMIVLILSSVVRLVGDMV